MCRTKEVLYSLRMSKLRIKSAHSDHSFTRSAHRPCLVVLVYVLPVCGAVCASMCCVCDAVSQTPVWEKLPIRFGKLVRHQIRKQYRSLPGKMCGLLESGCHVLESQHSSLSSSHSSLRVSSGQLSHTQYIQAKAGNHMPKS